MPSGHFMFAEEPTLGVWTLPTKAMPVVSSSIAASTVQNKLENQSTGLMGRGRMPQRVGTFEPGGNVEMLWYPQQIGYILRTVAPVRAKTAAGIGWLNKLLPDDDLDNGSLSVQEKYSDLMAISSRGLKLNQMTLRLAVGEYARWTFEFLGMDTASNDENWLDGTAGPPVILSEPYVASLIDPFTFWEAEMRLGGTVALTAGELVVTGGTPRMDFDDIEIAWNFNLDGDAFGVNLGRRYRQSIPEGARDISASFAPNWDLVQDEGLEFWQQWKAGTPAAIQVNLVHEAEFAVGQPYRSKITLPQVTYDGGPIPEVNRQYGLRRLAINATAEVSPDVDYDWGMTITSEDDLTL